MFKKTLISLTLLLPLFFVACSSSSEEDESNMVASNVFQLITTSGQELNVTKEGQNFIVQGHENKVIMFDIFATWCPPCRAEAPHLSHLQKKI